jgi:hypothetical protein
MSPFNRDPRDDFRVHGAKSHCAVAMLARTSASLAESAFDLAPVLLGQVVCRLSPQEPRMPDLPIDHKSKRHSARSLRPERHELLAIYQAKIGGG